MPAVFLPWLCLSSPDARLRYEPPGISSTVSVTCGLPFGCHVDWLGKCAFGCGNNAFGAYARECVSKSHSPARLEYRQVVLSCLASDLCLLLPCSSVHVSLSSPLDEAFAFCTIPPLLPCGGHLLAQSTPVARGKQWLLRSTRLFCAVVGLGLTAELVGSEYLWNCNRRPLSWSRFG